MPELEFSFREVLDEVEAMAIVAEPFISAECVDVLPQLRDALRSFQSVSTHAAVTWGIGDARPLRTQHSAGEYETGRRRGTLHVYADVTSVWRIAQVRQGIGQKRRAERFSLAGKASTRVRIHSAVNGDEIAMWRMEIGDSHSPGCHFHVQVRGQDEELPFPKALSVPRLPAVHSSPSAVIEFVLSELFQDKWDEHVAKQTPHLDRWAPIQRDRLVQLLEWQLKTVKDRSIGSPWVTLKRAKPEANLFAV